MPVADLSELVHHQRVRFRSFGVYGVLQVKERLVIGTAERLQPTKNTAGPMGEKAPGGDVALVQMFLVNGRQYFFKDLVAPALP